MNEMKKDSLKTQEDLKDEDSVVREWYIRRKSNAASVGLTHRDLLMRHQVSRGYICNFDQNFSLLCLFLNFINLKPYNSNIMVIACTEITLIG